MIAIIIDSYERTNQRSREIFGRAQVEYAAALVARKQFIRVSVREMACVFCGMQENAILTCTWCSQPKEVSEFHVAAFVPHALRKVSDDLYFSLLIFIPCVTYSSGSNYNSVPETHL